MELIKNLNLQATLIQFYLFIYFQYSYFTFELMKSRT
jgi:hypothetical protein